MRDNDSSAICSGHPAATCVPLMAASSRRMLQQPMCLHDLEAQLQQMWDDMPQDTIWNLYVSMAARITSCIPARGGPTAY
ncbi:hypothetical protein GDO78_019647 [Eleutherodactylus coqui]|uniref:Uncharacterized protein n=1 Tax=Eleutherodactylus coqui TaxID=57060 RepID=A0A8J6BBZ4_ELECQ|nr:hypothetical protein GDO78_019647 [Eleutherodactylus coqui]